MIFDAISRPPSNPFRALRDIQQQNRPTQSKGWFCIKIRDMRVDFYTSPQKSFSGTFLRSGCVRALRGTSSSFGPRAAQTRRSQKKMEKPMPPSPFFCSVFSLTLP